MHHASQHAGSCKPFWEGSPSPSPSKCVCVCVCVFASAFHIPWHTSSSISKCVSFLALWLAMQAEAKQRPSRGLLSIKRSGCLWWFGIFFWEVFGDIYIYIKKTFFFQPYFSSQCFSTSSSISDKVSGEKTLPGMNLVFFSSEPGHFQATAMLATSISQPELSKATKQSCGKYLVARFGQHALQWPQDWPTCTHTHNEGWPACIPRPQDWPTCTNTHTLWGLATGLANMHKHTHRGTHQNTPTWRDFIVVTDRGTDT